MTRKGLYKEFLDEILPLSYYVEQAYPSSYMVEPIIGNQGYDAIVYDDSGAEIDRLELTRPHDGAESAKDARLVVNRGLGTTKVDDPGSDIEAILPIVLSTCKAKSQKDYSDCTLVIIIGVQPPFSGFEQLHEEKLQRLVSAVSAIEFRAKRVCLFIPPRRVIPIAG